MKILFINTVYAKGSTGTIIRDTGKYLEANGHEYKVAVGRRDDSDEHVYRIGNDIDMHLHALCSRITDRAGFYSKKETRKFLNFVRDYNPDIIHLHNLHGYYINLPILFNFLKTEFKGRVFWTLHDCWTMTGHCTHFTAVGCYKWKGLCSSCPQTRNFPKSYFLDSSSRNHKDKKSIMSGIPNVTVVAVSDWLKSVASESLLKGYYITRVYNGIDLNKFIHTESNILAEHGIKGKKVILSVADGFDEQKGLPALLAVAKEAPADWQFLIIGIEKRYMNLLPNNVTGMERTSNQQELIKFYSAADVFYNPSIEETFGLVTAEAMACGTPAVVMNSTACPELIINDECGIVLDVNSNPKQVVNALTCAMGKSGARKAAENFSVENQCRGYYELYTSVSK